MPRIKSLVFPLSLIALSLAGCGGSKQDFSILPKSFSIETISPKDATGVAITGISRDGRLMGTYLKKGVKTVFGWTPDGSTSDILLPKECKEARGINELGGLACVDTQSNPDKMFQWQNGSTDQLNLPTGALIDSVGSITYNSFFLVNLHFGTGETQGYQIKITDKPKLLTTSGGQLIGSSLSGNITGFDQVNGKKQAIAYIEEKKISMGFMAGKETIGNSINDAGIVVGDQLDDNGFHQAFRWAKSKYTALPNPVGATKSVALDINDSGVIAGYAEVNGELEACMWYPNKPATLVKDLVTPPSGVKLTRAVKVTPLGIVICDGTRTKANVTNAEAFALSPQFP